MKGKALRRRNAPSRAMGHVLAQEHEQGARGVAERPPMLQLKGQNKKRHPNHGHIDDDTKREAKEYLRNLRIFHNSMLIDYLSRLGDIKEIQSLKDEGIVSVIGEKLLGTVIDSIGTLTSTVTNNSPFALPAVLVKAVYEGLETQAENKEHNRNVRDLLTLKKRLRSIFKKMNAKLADLVNAIDEGREAPLAFELANTTWDGEKEMDIEPLGNEFEIGLWKNILKTKGRHIFWTVTVGLDIPFMSKSKDDAIRHMNKMRKKYPSFLFNTQKMENGYYGVQGHKLGIGNFENLGKLGPSISGNAEETAIGKRICDTLGVSQKEILRKWNLKKINAG